MKKYVLLLFSTMIISCSTDVKLLKIRNDFTYNNFSTSKFYITHVINQTSIRSLEEADIRLEKAFKDKKKYLIIYGANYTLSKITNSKEPNLLYDILNEYKVTNNFNNFKILAMSKYLDDGYVVFSVLDNFDINEREYNTSYVVGNAKGGTENVSEHTREVKSTIHGLFYIFELKTGKLCFSVEHERSDIRSSSRTERGCFDSCLFSFLDGITGSGPSPYGANDMAEYLFTDIVQAIPGKGEKIEKLLKKDNHFELQ